MNTVTIDCAGLENPRQLHKLLADGLHFPEWYGSNLDALHDCLAALPCETELILLHFSTLPAFANGFRRVLQDAQQENPNLTIHIL